MPRPFRPMMWLRVRGQLRDRHTAQAIVGAEREHEHPDVALERAD